MSHFPAPIHAPSDLAPFHLNGTQDMLTLFELMPLYDRSVRPYLRPDVAPDASEADKAAAHARRATIPKTYWHHVSDITRQNTHTQTHYRASYASRTLTYTHEA